MLTRKQAAAFVQGLKNLLDSTKGGPDDPAPDNFRNIIESHFYMVDGEIGSIPNRPIDLGVIPSHSIRREVGIVTARDYFYGMGETQVILKMLADYRGDTHLLDVGCGFGRIAMGLLHMLRPPGSYTGFDINPMVISFANALFKQFGRSADFRFDHVPMTNTFYTQERPQVDAERFQFPYPDNHFDVTVLFSVFTHLRVAAVQNYVRNFARVSRPGARVLTSVFLVENRPPSESTPGWRPCSRRQQLCESPDPRDRGQLLVANPTKPDYFVAFRLPMIQRIFIAEGFEQVGDPHWGSWSGRPDYLSYQDYVVFRKRG
jgi:SAM-dependent methyltransferase